MSNDELKVKSEKLKVSEGTSGPGLDTLLPTQKIIEAARTAGVNFGPGETQERIRYFIKLGLLPHAVRKAIQDSNSQDLSQVTGHLPFWTVARLVKVDRLKRRGLSYPQIAAKIKRAEQKSSFAKASVNRSAVERAAEDKHPEIFGDYTRGLLIRSAFGLFLGLTLLFGIVYTSLLIGGEKTQRFWKESEPAFQVKGGAKSEQEQILGVSDSKVYQSASNIFSKIARPFVNLAMVMIYGADWRVEYNFAQRPEEFPSAEAGENEPSAPSDISLLSGLTVNGDAVIKQSLTAGSLTVKGDTKLGTKFTDKVTVGGSFASDLVPFKTAAYNLGTGGERWKSGYFSDNVFIGDENRLGSDGMNVKGSMYLNTRSGGSIYLDADSGTVYLGEGTNKLSNADNNTALTIDPSGNGKIQFHSASNYIDADGNLVIAGSITFGTCSGCTLTVQEGDTTVDGAASTLDFLGGDFDVTSSPSGEANIALAATLTTPTGVSGDWTISNTTPSLFLTDTTSGEEDFSVNADGSSFTIRNESDSRNDLTISGAGAFTISGASVGEGTSILTVSSGDLVLTDGDLTLSSGEVAITSDDTTTDVFTLTASSLTTGSALVLTGSSTTGVTDHFVKVTADVGSGTSLLNLNPDFSGSAVTGYGIYQAATDATTNANIDYGLYSSLALTGNAAKTGYGQYTTVTSTSTTADILIAADFLTDHNAATASGNKTLYGMRSQLTNDGITDAAGTHNLYAGYFAATGNTGGTQTAFGIYGTAASGDTNYALYSTVTTAAANYALYTANGNVANILGASDFVYIDGSTTANTGTAGVLNIDVSSGTTNNRGLDLSYTSTLATTTNQYGIYSLYTNAQAVSTSSMTQNHYGAYLTTSKTGNNGAGSQTINVFGINSTTSLTEASGTDGGTRNTYGGYFKATGDTEGAHQVFGIYGTAASGDTNYGLYSTASGSGLTNYGIYTSASSGTDYGIWSNAGNVFFKLAADEKTYINATTTANTGTAGVLAIDVTSLTNQSIGLALSYTSTAVTAVTQYGLFNNFASTKNFIATSPTVNYFGDYGLTTKSGADDLFTSGTFNTYGTFSDTRNTSTDSTDPGTRNTYAGYFTATGAGPGTTTSYGIYATAASADTNWAGYFSGAVNVTGNLTVGGGTIDSSGAATNISIKDNTASAFTIKEGSNTYVDITTTDNTESFTINLPTGGGTSQTASLFASNIAKTINLGTGTAADTINIGTGATGADTITIGNNASTTSLAFTSGTGSQTFTSSVATGTAFSFVSNSVTTGNALTLSSTGTTTGEIVDLTGTWAPTDGSTNEAIDINITHSPTTSADNFQSINLTTTDGTALGNTVYGLSNTLTLTGNAAKIGYGDYATVTSTSTTADTLYGGYFYTNATGNAARSANFGALAYGNTSSTTADSVYGLYGATVASGAVSSGTRSQYGLYGMATASGAVSTATSNTYGGIFNAVVTAGTATETGFGVYGTASGADTNYALYSTVTTAAANYALYTANGNVSNILGASDKVYINGTTTANTSTTGVLDVDVTSLTNQSSGLNLLYTSTATASAAATQYGIYSLFNASTALGATNNNMGYYGIYSALTKSGDDNDTFGGIIQSYGAYITSTNTGNSEFSAQRDTWGAYISATGDTASGGDNNVYGIYTTASGATFNYGLVSSVSSAQTSGYSYGVYSTTSQTGVITVGSVPFIGLYNNVTKTGADTSTGIIRIYGMTNIVSYTGSAVAGTRITYGGYSTATGDTAGISSVYGFYVSAAGADNNAGLFVNSISSAVTRNYGIQIGNMAGATTAVYGINMGTLAGGAGSSVYGVNTGTMTAVASGTNAQLNLGAITSAASSTTYGISVGAISGTAASSTNYGMNIGAISSTGTSNYGIKITAVSGAATNNYGMHIDTVSGATNNYGICFDCDGTYTPTTAAGGIQWGTDGTIADNLALYRSANGTATLELGDGTDLIAAAAATFSINLDNTTSRTERLCHGGGDAGTGVAAVSDCSTSPGDYAEFYGSSDSSLEAGEIVIADPNRNAEEIFHNGSIVPKAWVIKSVSTYQPSIIGIVSTNPNETIGNVFTPDENPRPIALNGRVPVKVTGENGPILAGDALTSSSTPGAAMRASRAGRVVGIALESFSGTQGTVIAFINPSWYMGDVLADGSQTVAAVEGELLTDSLLNPDGTLVQNQPAQDSQTLTAEQIKTLVSEEVARQVAGLEVSTAEATDSAALIEESQKTLNELNSLLETVNLKLETLTVTGNTNLAQTQVAGTFSQDGTLIIDYGRQINVLGSTLYLQNDSLAGGLDIGGGKVTIDKDGNLVIGGELTAKRLTTNAISIDNSNPDSQSTGTGTIARGQFRVVISTSVIKEGAKIFITPTSQTGTKILYVSEKVPFDSFTVSLDGGASGNDVTFDWLIINEI